MNRNIKMARSEEKLEIKGNSILNVHKTESTLKEENYENLLHNIY
jgi:hypothetical protein